MYYVGLTYSLLLVIINCYRNPFFVSKNESVYSHWSLSIVKYFLQDSRILPQGVVRYEIGKGPTIFLSSNSVLLLNNFNTYNTKRVKYLPISCYLLYEIIICYSPKVECMVYKSLLTCMGSLMCF